MKKVNGRRKRKTKKSHRKKKKTTKFHREKLHAFEVPQAPKKHLKPVIIKFHCESLSLSSSLINQSEKNTPKLWISVDDQSDHLFITRVGLISSNTWK